MMGFFIFSLMVIAVTLYLNAEGYTKAAKVFLAVGHGIASVIVIYLMTGAK